MVIFTGFDKALLERTARLLDAQAKRTGWEDIADSRKRKSAKLEFDRLTRDARDLRMLAARLMKAEKANRNAVATVAAGQADLVTSGADHA